MKKSNNFETSYPPSKYIYNLTSSHGEEYLSVKDAMISKDKSKIVAFYVKKKLLVWAMCK